MIAVLGCSDEMSLLNVQGKITCCTWPMLICSRVLYRQSSGYSVLIGHGSVMMATMSSAWVDTQE